MKAAVKAIAAYNGPVYVRLGRLADETINIESYQFELGKGCNPARRQGHHHCGRQA